MANKAPIPKTYKGKPTAGMSVKEFEQMYKELGLDKPSKYSPAGDFNEEPDMPPKKKMAKGGAVKAFKPCPGCPSPAKCKAAGKCAMKAKKGAAGAKVTSKGAAGMLVIPVKVSKAPAKKKK